MIVGDFGLNEVIRSVLVSVTLGLVPGRGEIFHFMPVRMSQVTHGKKIFALGIPDRTKQKHDSRRQATRRSSAGT